MMEQLLSQLERYDTYPAEAALRTALQNCFEPGPGHDASEVLWDEWISGEGQPGWQTLVAWADRRLNAWHSLKINALETAWQFESDAQDLQGMLKAVLISLRQGIHDHPELLGDAHFLQELARAKHSFSFTQVIRELRSSGVLPPAEQGSPETHCLVCANAFKYLVHS